MADEQEDPSVKRMSVGDLKMEPAAEELLASPAMRPYMNLALAVMGHKDPRSAVEEITALPLEERYTWRGIGAEMGIRGLRESERLCGSADTLSQEDLDKLVDLLRVRPFNSACSWPRCLAKSRWRN